MLYKKFQMLAQIVGCVTIGLLAVYGLLMILSADSPVWAARNQASLSGVPNVINYQGMLRRPDGSVINGSYTMTFRLYGSPTADITDAVHTEVLTNTVVRDGLFTVLLGDIQPIDAAAFKQPLYVGIQVENDAEMQPRPAHRPCGHRRRSGAGPGVLAAWGLQDRGPGGTAPGAARRELCRVRSSAGGGLSSQGRLSGGVRSRSIRSHADVVVARDAARSAPARACVKRCAN